MQEIRKRNRWVRQDAFDVRYPIGLKDFIEKINL